MKPGYQTTEFWGKVVVQIIAFAVLFGVVPGADQGHVTEVSLGLIAAVEAAYNVARGLAKAGGSAS